VIKQLEGHKMLAADRMQHFDAYIDPVTHQVQQTIYLARRNAKPIDKTDLFEVISWTKPETAVDEASLEKCKMKALADVPVFDT
jgi:branched-chain amino acid transport system substrate-binding protein